MCSRDYSPRHMYPFFTISRIYVYNSWHFVPNPAENHMIWNLMYLHVTRDDNIFLPLIFFQHLTQTFEARIKWFLPKSHEFSSVCALWVHMFLCCVTRNIEYGCTVAWRTLSLFKLRAIFVQKSSVQWLELLNMGGGGMVSWFTVILCSF